MIDIIEGWFAYALMNLPGIGVAFNIIFLLLIVWYLIRKINSNENKLDWTDLVSTKGSDGKEHADIDKIGKCFGVIMAVWLPFMYAHSEKMEASGLVMVMSAALAYLAGVSAYSAWLRSKQSSDSTTGILK